MIMFVELTRIEKKIAERWMITSEKREERRMLEENSIDRRSIRHNHNAVKKAFRWPTDNESIVPAGMTTIFLEYICPWQTKRNDVDGSDGVLCKQRDYFPLIWLIHRRSVESIDSFLHESLWNVVDSDAVSGDDI